MRKAPLQGLFFVLGRVDQAVNVSASPDCSEA